MIEFDIKFKDVEFYEVEEGYHNELINELQKMDGLKYHFKCSSPKNSYQFASTLDNEIYRFLTSYGHSKLQPQFPQSPVRINYDLCLDIGGKTVVFEIEKANKEKVFIWLFKIPYLYGLWSEFICAFSP